MLMCNWFIETILSEKASVCVCVRIPSGHLRMCRAVDIAYQVTSKH